MKKKKKPDFRFTPALRSRRRERGEQIKKKKVSVKIQSEFEEIEISILRFNSLVEKFDKKFGLIRDE